jgi:hypothetical protein
VRAADESSIETAELVDAILERLRPDGWEGTLEVHFKRDAHGLPRLTKLRRHEVFTRGDVAIFNPAIPPE